METELSTSALGDILVVDLSRILAGPYCTMLLGDYGARVIKVEKPGEGDGTRQWGPPWVGSQSAYFLTANRNKQSLTLDLRRSEGLAVLLRLVERADVLIENFIPGVTERMGIDYQSLATRNPGLIYCSISGYGQTGPYRDRPGYDFMIQAHGGIMSVTGPADGEPSKVGVAICDITAGLYASNAILAALHYRERTGTGQYIDVSLLDSQIGWLANVAQNFFATGSPPQRFGNAHPNIVPYESFQTSDGYIALAVGSDRQFEALCASLQIPEISADERFNTNPRRVENRHILIPLLQARLQYRGSREWIEIFVERGIPAAPINSIPDALNDPHVQARGMVVGVDDDSGSKTQLIGPVAKLSQTPAQVKTAPPHLGQHSDEVLKELGYSPTEIASLRDNGIV